MWQRVAFVITVVLLGFSGGVLALFVRGMHAERGAVAGFCFVSALAIVQAWMVASEIAKARSCPVIFEMHVIEELKRNFELFPSLDCVQSLGVLPLALIGANSGAQGRFATVMLGGVVFSTIAALTVMPVLIARIAE